jgi:hypothetical protein
MKVEMIRSRLYNGQTLERGRVVDVDTIFGRWLINRGMALEYNRPSFFSQEAPKRGRPRKGD